uniref:Ig-like domain-containing protein n=1 Tax=Haemonchus contortus TaxID=6289 RepID=A0A7I4Y0Y6_HAECO
MLPYFSNFITSAPLQIVPVYFWPGDQVDLPCLMCELAFVFNGKMKIWGRSTKILRFLENPKRGTRFSYKLWSRVENGPNAYKFGPRNISEMKIKDTMPEVLDKEGNKLYIMKQEPVFIQRKGKLTILRASPASQGVYFCYDAQSRSHTSIFYVLMAMTPPVRMSEMKDVLADGCIDKEDHQLIRANFNWRYHFVPNIRHEAPARCKNSKLGFCQAKYFDQTETEEGCTLNFCRKEIEAKIELNLALEMRWDDWGECDTNRQMQKREAHCYLVRKAGYEIPMVEEELPNEYRWMPKLNALFNHEPFRSKGIRLYSSLLASLFVNEEIMLQCHYEKRRLETDQIWRMLMRSMGASYKEGPLKGKIAELDEDGKYKIKPESSLRLTNPFHACMIYEYNHSKDSEHVVGTYMTETRPCESKRTT